MSVRCELTQNHCTITAVTACPPLGRCLFGGRLVGLTRRSLLFEHCLTEPDHCLLASDTSAAAANNGFLAEVLQCNDGIRQQVSALASQDWQQDLEFVEVTTTAPAAGGDIDRLPNTQKFKEALRDVAIGFSGAKGKDQIIYVKWRSEGNDANGVNRTTIFNIQ